MSAPEQSQTAFGDLEALIGVVVAAVRYEQAVRVVGTGDSVAEAKQALLDAVRALPAELAETFESARVDKVSVAVLDAVRFESGLDFDTLVRRVRLRIPKVTSTRVMETVDRLVSARRIRPVMVGGKTVFEMCYSDPLLTF